LVHSPRRQRVHVSVGWLKGRPTVTISDRGPGMPELGGASPATLRHGLGLYIARRVIDAHGGDLWFESRPRGGTRCRIALGGRAG
jgi:signal transduction histidine kinase